MTTDAGLDLPAPVRVQVQAVAAEVVGRLPADELPVALRPLARFAPAKRARLGAAALAAALDTDDEFRAAVADVVAESSPDLVAAVAEGAALPASDPVDVAVVAYLTRPAGWREVLATALERWSGEHDALDRTRAELTELRSEVARLRAQTRGEPARVREAVAAALGDTAEQARDTARRLRLRTGELRAAERDAALAREEAAQARAQLDALRAEHSAQLAQERARVADAAARAEEARRDVRAGRDLDDARLRLLTETLVAAAQGLRRELALPPVTLRPADTVAGGADATAGGSVRDGAELEQVLALPQLHVLVDGYNVTKTGYPELPLADQRARLVTALAALAGRTGVETTVVFDGAARPAAQPATPRGVRVLFSAADEIADDVLRRLVAAEPAGRPLLVATSDAAVVRDVQRAGARTVPSAVLLTRLR